MTRLRVGACLSLTGRFGRFGRQAAHGLMAWQLLTDAEVEFQIEDDGSDPDQFSARIRSCGVSQRPASGPYWTQLMREAGQAIAAN